MQYSVMQVQSPISSRKGLLANRNSVRRKKKGAGIAKASITGPSLDQSVH